MRHLQQQMMCMGAMMLLLIKAAQLPTTFGSTDLLLGAQHDSMVKTYVKDPSAIDSAGMANTQAPLPFTQKKVHRKHGTHYHINEVTDSMPLQDRPKMVRVINGEVHTTKEEMVPTYNGINTTQTQMSTTIECSNDTMPVQKISERRVILPFILGRVLSTETSGQHSIATVTKSDQNIGKHLVDLTAILEESNLNVAHTSDVQTLDSHSISSASDLLGSNLLQVFNPYNLPVKAKATPLLKDNPAVGRDIHENQNSPTTAETQQAQGLKHFGNSRSIRSAVPSNANERIVHIISLWPFAGTRPQSPTITTQNLDTGNNEPVSTADALPNPEIGFIPAHRPNDQAISHPEPCENPVAHPVPAINPIAVHKPAANPIAVHKPATNPIVVPRPIASPIAVPRPITNPIAVPRPSANPIAFPRPLANLTAIPRPSAISMLVPQPVTNPFTIQKMNGIQRITYNPSLGSNSQSHESREDDIYSDESKDDEVHSSESNESGFFPLSLSSLYKK